MIEYACEGGQLSDLNHLPPTTGKIRISNMPIQRITANTFSRFGSELWVLGCSHCGIMDIEPDAFRHLSNLQQLSLNNNQLTTVKESWFRGLDYLTYLDLNYNSISSIENGVFKNLPSLVDLRLSGNRLECLNLAAMSQLKDLKRIFLSENAEFKCPNAVSSFLENRGVNFEKDPEWSKLTNDLIPVEMLLDDAHDEEVTTREQTTLLPAHRERLHPTPMTPSSTMPSTVPHILSTFYTTEEVVYPPRYTYDLDSRTSARPPTIPYEDAELASPLYDTVRTPYVPPRTIAPIDSTTASETVQYSTVSQDVTTLRSWPRFPESTSARSEYPIYPPHRNQNKDTTEQPDYSGSTDSFPSAASPDERHQTTSYAEPDTERTGVFVTEGSGRNTAPTNLGFTPRIESRGPEYPETPASPSDTSHVVRPSPQLNPKMVHPVPVDPYQPPYYEPTMTVHPPPLMGNKQQHEEVTPGIMPIETTTDKPLPQCPNLSPSTQVSLTMIMLPVLLATMRRVLVEGF